MAEVQRIAELAARVEAAEGPDREIDNDISFLLSNAGERVPCGATWNHETQAHSYIAAHPYTASLDAAMTLAGDGFGSLVAGHLPDGRAGFIAVVTKPSRAEGEAATPALALTAASLRAHAAQGARP